MSKDIDHKIAEKVMGWNLRKTYDVFEQWYDEEWPRYWKDSWHPSEDIAQAFEVVEKMFALGYYVEMDNIGEPDIEWAVDFTKIKTLSDEFCFGAHAKTSAMAICLAALKVANGGGEGGGV